MIRAALNGSLDNIPLHADPYFGVAVPEGVPGVPDEILNPRQTWADPQAYDQQARLLVAKFQENFTQFSGQVAPEIAAAGPKLA
jgi:phosphoenolpyruvate carboxykinase (ATP)